MYIQKRKSKNMKKFFFYFVNKRDKREIKLFQSFTELSQPPD